MVCHECYLAQQLLAQDYAVVTQVLVVKYNDEELLKQGLQFLCSLGCLSTGTPFPSCCSDNKTMRSSHALLILLQMPPLLTIIECHGGRPKLDSCYEDAGECDNIKEYSNGKVDCQEVQQVDQRHPAPEGRAQSKEGRADEDGVSSSKIKQQLRSKAKGISHIR